MKQMNGGPGVKRIRQYDLVKRMRSAWTFESTEWRAEYHVHRTGGSPVPVMRVDDMLFTRFDWEGREMPDWTVAPDGHGVLAIGSYTDMTLAVRSGT